MDLKKDQKQVKENTFRIAADRKLLIDLNTKIAEAEKYREFVASRHGEEACRGQDIYIIQLKISKAAPTYRIKESKRDLIVALRSISIDVGTFSG